MGNHNLASTKAQAILHDVPPLTIPTLETPRLTLRSLRPEDAPDIVDISVYDGVPAANEADALAMLERIEADCARGDSLHWGILWRNQDEILGTCGFYRGFQNNVGEIGYILRSAYRGQGIMTEAVEAVVAYGMADLLLAAIVAYTDRDNVASKRLLMRAGFLESGMERGYCAFRYAARKPAD